MNTGRGILVYKLKNVTYLIQLIKKTIQNSINIETAEKKKALKLSLYVKSEYVLEGGT